MDVETAIAFLAAHQPMPPDTFLTDELIAEFNAMREFLIHNPDSRSLPLLLGALPSGRGGFGVYQLVDDVLRAHPQAEVINALVSALRSSSEPRTWALDLALEYHDQRLVEEARSRLGSSDEDEGNWRSCTSTFTATGTSADVPVGRADLQLAASGLGRRDPLATA